MRHRDPKPANMSAETKPAGIDRRAPDHVSADARPSIAALRRIVEHDPGDAESDGMVCAACHVPFVAPPDLDPSSVCNPCAQAIVADAAPVLLEIAAAALAEQGAWCDCDGLHGCDDECAALVAHRAYRAALAKVRP